MNFDLTLGCGFCFPCQTCLTAVQECVIYSFGNYQCNYVYQSQLVLQVWTRLMKVRKFACTFCSACRTEHKLRRELSLNKCNFKLRKNDMSLIRDKFKQNCIVFFYQLHISFTDTNSITVTTITIVTVTIVTNVATRRFLKKV